MNAAGATNRAVLEPVAVLGAGSWGTALAIQLARAGAPTALWGRNRAQLEELGRQRCNARYLPGAAFPDSLRVEPDLTTIGRDYRVLLVCVPSQAFRQVLGTLAGNLRADSRVAWATKGFEQQTGKLPHQVAGELLGAAVPLAVLSGPTFAVEVAAGLPTAMTLAATDPGFAMDLAARISHHGFRAYTSADIVGVEVGGAVKNVLAIATGISDGLGFGANTRVALITRGLMEMTRLGVALGARAETFTGLSGMGDLVLTCTDDQSRNRRFGLALAAGKGAAESARTIGFVVEGHIGARSVHEVSRRVAVDMPICEQVYRILYDGAAPQEAVMALMNRTLKPEIGI